jgi:hypothetical protein
MKAQRASSERGVRPDSGRGLVGLLVAIVILAGLAAAVLGFQDGSGGDHQGQPGAAASTPNASPAKAVSDVEEAAQIACRSNYELVSEALDEYRIMHGQRPATMAALAPMLRDTVSSQYYTITIDTVGPGTVAVATPGHPTAAGDANCAYAGSS